MVTDRLWWSQETPSTAASDEAGITVVDLCAGKGVFSMLLSFLLRRRPRLQSKVARVVMIEKQVLNWHHIHATNADMESPATDACETVGVTIDLWDGCNIFDNDFRARLAALPGRLAIVGIHLCRNLSPRAVGLFNSLGTEKTPFLLLAPW